MIFMASKKLLFTDNLPDNVLQIKSMQKFKSAKTFSQSWIFAEIFLQYSLLLTLDIIILLFFQLGKRL